ncbi:MAG TPA: hypothetical protein VGJ20_08980 [Xanthobacteraceae bacterium]
MWQDWHRNRRVAATALLRAVSGATLAALVLCTHAGSARAGDGDDPEEAFYHKLMQTLGLKQPGADHIDYNERSPLVVPPTRDLPPPEAAAAPSDPDWPKDPDMQRRQAAKHKERVVPHADYVVDSSRPLRPDELNVAGAHPSAGNAAGPGGSQQPTPADTGAKKGIFSFDWLKPKQEYAAFTGEPERQSLTDPPPGYQTPSADEPYGVGPEKKQYKIQSVGDRVTESSGTAASGN